MGAQTFPRIWRVSVSAGKREREDIEGKEDGMKRAESEARKGAKGGLKALFELQTRNIGTSQLGSLSPPPPWIPARNCPVNYNKMEGKARNNLSRKLIKTYRPELRTFSNGRGFVIISPRPLYRGGEGGVKIKSWYLYKPPKRIKEEGEKGWRRKKRIRRIKNLSPSFRFPPPVVIAFLNQLYYPVYCGQPSVKFHIKM